MIRLFLIVLVFFVSLALAAGTAQVTRWQNLVIHHTEITQQLDDLTRVEVLNARGRVLATMTQTMTRAKVKDWTGDGVPELELYGYTGGAHCCTILAVLERTKTGVHNLFTFDAGNFGNLEPVQLDSDAKLELVGTSDVLAYFAGGYAYSPEVGVVFDWNGSKYELASKRFPRVLLKKAQESWRSYSSNKKTDYGYRYLLEYLANMTEAGQGAKTLKQILNDARVLESHKILVREDTKKLGKELSRIPCSLWQEMKKPYRFDDPLQNKC